MAQPTSHSRPFFHFDLQAAARRTMIDNGFEPDTPPAAASQLREIIANPPAAGPGPDVKDLRQLLWSSIDNDTSKDLDQIEYAERLGTGGWRLLVGIADVDAFVKKNTPIDIHAAKESTTVYTGVAVFPMLPVELSTGLTSLVEGEDRLSMVIEMLLDSTGIITSAQGYPAVVRNHAQLAYPSIGAWLEGRGEAPSKVLASADLQAQLRMQDEIAQAMRKQRYLHGALNLDRPETQAVTGADGAVTGLAASHKNRATELIEDFMIAANVTMAGLLDGIPSIRRVVKTPERWSRIVELAARYGEKLPETPDSGALNAFLLKRKAADPDHYPDLSLAVLKLLGPGEYVMERPGDQEAGHFSLAVQDYTHSTAPNRRFADIVTQRLLKAVLQKKPSPYAEDELSAIARNCTLKEDAARKVERLMQKRIAAVAMAGRVGETFHAIVTGVTPKGTFVRVTQPPVEGRMMRGEQGLDVGDAVDVRLLATDPGRGFIDFGR
jgi:VacB/RNase II family 3'-5' exoribonuclease